MSGFFASPWLAARVYVLTLGRNDTRAMYRVEGGVVLSTLPGRK